MSEPTDIDNDEEEFAESTLTQAIENQIESDNPQHLPAICTALAERMGTSPLLLAEASTRNACELFNW